MHTEKTTRDCTTVRERAEPGMTLGALGSMRIWKEKEPQLCNDVRDPFDFMGMLHVVSFERFMAQFSSLAIDEWV